MPGFFFLNKAFLVGLAAVAIPLLIHLFTKRRARKQEFSTVSFLRDIARRETRRLRFRNLLLMVLRMAAIAAVVLAMARPALRGPIVKAEGSTSVVVVLDNSASMGVMKQGRALFDYAREAAKQVLGSLEERDQGALVPVCGEARPALVSGPTRLAGMVGLTPLSNRSARPDEPVALGYSLLAEAKSINKELYVISDFQASQWENARFAAGQTRDIRTTLVRVVTGAAGVPDNLYVRSAEVIPLGSPARQGLEFKLANSGRSPQRAVPVRVLADGAEVETLYVDVGPSDSATVGLEIGGSPGEITLSLPLDGLAADNDYFLAVQAPRQVRVLVVGEGIPPAGQDFTVLAMRVSQQFVPRRLRVSDLRERELAGAQCIILDNVARLTGRELEIVRGFRQSGGRVLIVLGDRVDIRHYNELLLPALFPARLVGVQSTKDRERSFLTLRAAIASHPILSQFRVSRGEPVCAARFFEAIRAEPLEGSTVVAQFSEELPGLVETEGALLFTSSFDRAWNELVTSGAFVPLLHEMLGYICGVSGGRGPDVSPGQFLDRGVVERAVSHVPGAPLSVTGPAGRVTATEQSTGAAPRGSVSGGPVSEGDKSALTGVGRADMPRVTEPGMPGAGVPELSRRIGPFEETGVYRLSAGTGEVLAFSVNIDAEESELRYLERSQLSRIARGAETFDFEADTGLAEFERSGRELWPIFVLVSLGLLVAELLVARSAGPPE